MIYDHLFAAVSFVFNLMFLPTLFNHNTYIPRITSMTYVVGLSVETIASIGLGLPWTTIAIVIGAIE